MILVYLFKLWSANYVNFVDLPELGVLSWRLDADNYETDEELKKIREDRGYSYMVCHTNLRLLILVFLS